MKRNLAIVITILFAVSAAYAAVTLPVTDNFPSTGAEQNWESYAGAYEVIESFATTAPGGDGYVMNVNDGSGWQKISLADDDGTLGDYKITAYIFMPNDETNWGRVGLFGRATSRAYNAGHYYLFADTDGDDYLRVGYYSDGHATWTQLLDPNGSITRGVWHKWELSFEGENITAKIDDVTVWSGTDSTYSTGYFGIQCYQDNSSAPATLCDRITIEATGSGVDQWELY